MNNESSGTTFSDVHPLEASPKPSVSKLLLSSELECPLCLSILLDPRVLSCQHCFCLKCIHSQWFSSSATFAPRNQTFMDISCPLKCKETTMVIGGLHQLPKNYIVSKLSEVARRAEIEQFYEGRSEEGNSCEWCSKRARSTPCMKCLSFVCEECSHAPQSMHAHLCLGNAKDRSTSTASPVSSQITHLNEKFPMFFYEEDALQLLFCKLRGLGFKENDLKVSVIQFWYQATKELSILTTLPNDQKFRFNLYYENEWSAQFMCNAYLKHTSTSAAMLRTASILRDLLRQNKKGLVSYAQQLVRCAKRLLPTVSKKEGKINQILTAPMGYFFFAFHLLWLAEQHLFIVRHFLFPSISKIQFFLLIYVDYFLQKEMPCTVEEDPWDTPAHGADTFSKGNFHALWGLQWELLHCSQGELSEAIEDLEEAVDEIQKIIQDFHFLDRKSDLRHVTNTPPVSLRYFLKEEHESTQALVDSTTLLLSHLTMLHSIVCSLSAECVRLVMRHGDSRAAARHLVQLQQEVLSFHLQATYLLWGNHRLHYSIISSIVAKTIFGESLTSAVFPLLLSSCYKPLSPSYDALGEQLLSCVKDFKEKKPLKGLWLILGTFVKDLEKQKSDARAAVQKACEVACYSSTVLECMDTKCRINQLTSSFQLPSSALNAFGLVCKASSLNYEDYVKFAEVGVGSLWLKGLECLLCQYFRVDFSFHFLYLTQDPTGLPQTTIFDHAWRTAGGLDVTLPSGVIPLSVWSQFGGYCPLLQEGCMTPSDEELGKTLEALETTRHQVFGSPTSFSTEWDERDTEAATDPPAIALENAVRALQHVAFSNWSRTSFPSSAPRALEWKVDHSLPIKVPIYRILFRVRKENKLLVLNAHTGVHEILALPSKDNPWKLSSYFHLPR